MMDRMGRVVLCLHLDSRRSPLASRRSPLPLSSRRCRSPLASRLSSGRNQKNGRQEKSCLQTKFSHFQDSGRREKFGS